MERVDVRKDILELIPYKELLTADQIVEIIEDHHKFTPKNWVMNLSKKVKDCIVDLVEEGILSVSINFHPAGVRYYSEFKYYGR